jgi:hypothetical protein
VRRKGSFNMSAFWDSFEKRAEDKKPSWWKRQLGAGAALKSRGFSGQIDDLTTGLKGGLITGGLTGAVGYGLGSLPKLRHDRAALTALPALLGYQLGMTSGAIKSQKDALKREGITQKYLGLDAEFSPEAEEKYIRKKAALSAEARSILGSSGVGGILGATMGGSAGALQGDDWKERFKKGLMGAGIGALGGAAFGGLLAKDSIKRQKNWERYYQNSRRGSSGGYGGYSGRGFRPTGENLADSLKNIGATGTETTKSEVRKKYLAMAMKHHPDRGGSEDMMKRVNSSWDNLQSDPWFQKLAFLRGFSKRATLISSARGFASKGRHITPPIPGPKIHMGSASALPGQGAMVMGKSGIKSAPQSIKGRGVGGMAVP